MSEPKKRADDFPKVLVCIVEGEMPGIGAWKKGDEITDAKLIQKLNGHPYFKPKEDK